MALLGQILSTRPSLDVLVATTQAYFVSLFNVTFIRSMTAVNQTPVLG